MKLKPRARRKGCEGGGEGQAESRARTGIANIPTGTNSMKPKLCPLCDEGFPLSGDYHIPTQSKGMIPVTRCKGRPLRKAKLKPKPRLTFKGWWDKHKDKEHPNQMHLTGGYVFRWQVQSLWRSIRRAEKRMGKKEGK